MDEVLGAEVSTARLQHHLSAVQQRLTPLLQSSEISELRVRIRLLVMVLLELTSVLSGSRNGLLFMHTLHSIRPRRPSARLIVSQVISVELRSVCARSCLISYGSAAAVCSAAGYHVVTI